MRCIFCAEIISDVVMPRASFKSISKKFKSIFPSKKHDERKDFDVMKSFNEEKEYFSQQKKGFNKQKMNKENLPHLFITGESSEEFGMSNAYILRSLLDIDQVKEISMLTGEFFDHDKSSNNSGSDYSEMSFCASFI